MKDKIIDILATTIKLSKEQIANMLEIPPTENLGDYAFPCFSLTKEYKKSPAQIAEELATKLRKHETKEIASIENTGPYINIFTNKNLLAQTVLKETAKNSWGTLNTGKGKTMVIDMSSPNIAKPFGIGHLRSTIIGDSVSNIAKAIGYKTIKINYLGDWGTQFGKMIVGYKKWGKEEQLKKNPITHLQGLYIKVNADKELEQAARDEFKKLESGNKENLNLWKTFKELSLKEFDKTYKILNITFDKIDAESNYNTKMNAIVESLQKKKLLKKDKDALIIDLNAYNLGVGIIQKSDGTSLYITRDLAAIADRYNTYKFDQILYEVGSEQSHHFNQLFKIGELSKAPWANKAHHIAHGLYLDKDGKKFSTRKGKTVYMQDVLEQTVQKAKDTLKEKTLHLSEKELDKRAQQIAIAAIKYGDLKNHRTHNSVFDIDKFLESTGDTGPYLLYSYARANSILTKSKSTKKVEITDLKDSEITLLKLIHSYPEIIQKAFNDYAPNIIANYTYSLAKAFNEFYHNCPVLGGPEEGFRLALTKSFLTTMHKSLNILGIEPLKEM